MGPRRQGQTHVEASSAYRRLNADPTSPLAEIAAELRLLDSLRAETVELGSLVTELDRQSHELRLPVAVASGGVAARDARRR